jgi:hypothetical protein
VPLVAIRSSIDWKRRSIAVTACVTGCRRVLRYRPCEIDVYLDRAAAGVQYVNRRTGATTGGMAGHTELLGWKGSA